MKHIYNELRIHEGKLTEFGHVLVEKNIYSDVKIAIASLRNNVKPKEDVQQIYDEWKHGKFKTKDVEKYNNKLEKVFKDIKRKSLKEELINIQEVLESALMELTLSIKRDDRNRLLTVKDMLQSALYGSK
jgi:alpha-L-arabinofuranosidase